jgi:hypothetical protein
MPDQLKRFAREGEPERRRVPDRREEGWHTELTTELTDHADRIETRLRRFYSRALGAFAVMGIACAVALAGFGVVLDAQKTTTATIQNQRYDALLQNCLDTNVRHDNAIKKIDDAAKNVPKKRRDPKGIAAFKAIIEATVPYTSDCRKFASSRVRGG